MTYKRSEILANRQKWIDYLQEPERKKTKNELESFYDNEARCCLGHAEFLFNSDRSCIEEMVYYGESEVNLSEETMNLLGMYYNEGEIFNSGHYPITSYLKYEDKQFRSLSILNDCTDITPQEIGKLLQGMIDGGENTPFKPLTDYEE